MGPNSHFSLLQGSSRANVESGVVAPFSRTITPSRKTLVSRDPDVEPRKVDDES